MSKRAKFILITIVILFVGALIYFGKKNKKSIIQFETETPFKTTIVKKTVATGKVIPQEEVEIKPQISGIIDKIYLEEGSIVKAGDLIATVRVVPNIQNLNSAKGRIKNSKLSFNNSKNNFIRTKGLFDKGVISRQDFENAELNYNNAKVNLENAQSDLEIIQKGSTAENGEIQVCNRTGSVNGILPYSLRRGFTKLVHNHSSLGKIQIQKTTNGNCCSP